MARKKSVQIPDWFDLSKYDEAENFTPQQWLEALSLRHQLLVWFREFEENLPAIKKDTLSLIEDPLAVHDFSLRSFEGPPIEPLTTRNFRFYKNRFNSALAKLGRDPNVFDDRNKESREWIDDLFESTGVLPGVHYHYLQIDLQSTDKTLIAAFKEHLKVVRERRQTPRARTPALGSKLNKLHDYHALPILDLLIWEANEGCFISRAQIATVLNEDVKRLDGVLLRFAKEVASEPFLAELGGSLAVAIHNPEKN